MQVVRCFEDGDIVHVAGKVDPLDDIDVINLELALADLATIEKRLERMRKGKKSKEEADKARPQSFSLSKYFVVLRQSVDLLSKPHIPGVAARLVSLRLPVSAIVPLCWLHTAGPLPSLRLAAAVLLAFVAAPACSSACTCLAVGHCDHL